MSSAARAGSPPGPRSESPGTAGLWCAVWAAGTAWAGVRPGRGLGLEAADLETAVSGALLTDVGRGACGAVVRPSLGVPVGRRIAGPGPRRPAKPRRDPAGAARDAVLVRDSCSSAAARDSVPPDAPVRPVFRARARWEE